MLLSAKSKNTEFEKAPKGIGRGVVVDVTPPETVESTFNGRTTQRNVFQIVFELDPETFGLRSNGEPYNVWSRKLTETLDERSNTRSIIRQILGRDLTPTELENFDTETLIGRAVEIMIAHVPSKNGTTTYASIASLAPWNPATNGGRPAYVASGKFVRKQDRPTKDAPQGAGASFRRADRPEESGREDWMKTKIHVGKFAGNDLGSIDEEAFAALYEKWRPTVSARQAAGEKISAADLRLLNALEAGKKAFDEAKAASAQAPDAPDAEDCPY